MTPGQQNGKKLTTKSLVDYIMSSKEGSKKVTNHGNVLLHSPKQYCSWFHNIPRESFQINLLGFNYDTKKKLLLLKMVIKHV
jgi:hypothetical protein